MYSNNRKRTHPDHPTHGNMKQKRDSRISEGDEGNQADTQDDPMEIEPQSQEAAASPNNSIGNSKVYRAYCKIWEDLVGLAHNGKEAAGTLCARIYCYSKTFKLRSIPDCDDEGYAYDLPFNDIAAELNNLGSDNGQREWNSITDGEVEELYGQENCLQLLRDLWAKVKEHPLYKECIDNGFQVVMRTKTSGCCNGMIYGDVNNG